MPTLTRNEKSSRWHRISLGSREHIHRAASSGAAIRTRLRRIHSAIYRQIHITPCGGWEIGELVDRLRAKFGERDMSSWHFLVQFRSQGNQCAEESWSFSHSGDISVNFPKINK